MQTVPFLQEYIKRCVEKDPSYLNPVLPRNATRHNAEMDEYETQNGAALDQYNQIDPEATLLIIVERLLRFHAPHRLYEEFPLLGHRLWSFRGYLQRLINLEIAWSILKSQEKSDNIKPVLEEYPPPRFVMRIWPFLVGEMGSSSWTAQDEHRRKAAGWLRNIRDVSLEITRLATATSSPDSCTVALIEACLQEHFTKQSSIFRRSHARIRQMLIIPTFYWLRQYLPLPLLKISELRNGVRLAPNDGNDRVTRAVDQHIATGGSTLDKIGKDLALIGVLHCRVWGLAGPA